MKTELLHKYFRGETTEKEESQIVEWTESSAENKERFLKERMLFDITLFSDDSKIQRKPKGHLYLYPLIAIAAMRSEERRVGKECRSRWSPYH